MQKSLRTALLVLCLWQTLPSLAAEPTKDNRPAAFYVLRFPGRGKIGEVGEISNAEKFDGKHTPLKKAMEALWFGKKFDRDGITSDFGTSGCSPWFQSYFRLFFAISVG